MGTQFPWQLVSFKRPTTHRDQIHLGLLQNNRVVDLTALWVAEGKPVPEGMRQFLEEHARNDLTDWLSEAVQKSKTTYSLEEASLEAPLTNPRMFYDFLGFEKHVRQIREKRGATVPELWYKRPAYYVGSVAPDKIFGPGEVKIPRFIEKPDYEFELALVVGRVGHLKTVSEAAEFIQQHCFLTLCNDWSARDYQKLDMDLGLGVSHSKSLIGTSFGPVMVHASQFRFNPEGVPDIPLRLVVNGETRSESNYQTVYWSFPKILAFLGQENISVFPGDILGSGTVGNGCIAEFGPKVIDGKEVEPAKYPWLRNGDQIALLAEGIGELSNRVVLV